MNRFRKEKPEEVAPVGTPDIASVTTGHQKDETVPRYAPADAENELNTFGKLHEWDPNMDREKIHAIENAVKEHDVEAEMSLEADLEENSPYPEVMAAVPNTDDVSLPANTVRAWILGMTFVTLGSGLNMLFSLRNPTISITSIVAQLCAYPIGVLMAKVLPTHQFNFFGLKWTLNPGPFNMKEHTLITIMANVSFAGGAAYSTYTIEAMMGFYHINWGVGFALCFTIVTQMIGLGLAGVSTCSAPDKKPSHSNVD
jgi:hypothetical protein